uniref:Transcobalamin-like C-terminal domain-containing protein n=1 Tax=Electrophorus electricus TaxID=8005 RepID=A0AAY5EWL3_ELEEL
MVYRDLFLLSMPLLTCLSCPMVFPTDLEEDQITLIVFNSLINDTKNYITKIAHRGILLGAMRRLQKNHMLNFTVTEYPDYGPFLVSVNGLARNDTQKTYWEILDKLQNGTIIRPDVGVGCFIPNPNDTVILKFTTWKKKDVTTV